MHTLVCEYVCEGIRGGGDSASSISLAGMEGYYFSKKSFREENECFLKGITLYLRLRFL